MRILVVDDEPDVEILFKQRFRREIQSGQWAFDFTDSGEATLSYLVMQDMSDLALILSDINMPGMNGLDLLRVVKYRYPHIKVMMLTANGDKHTRQKALDYGSDGFFIKPVDFSAVKEKIMGIGVEAWSGAK
jgi:CheY-like chemotaxis protein